MSVLLGFALIIIIVVIHEAGHTLAARAFDVGVQKFSIGFGPGFTLWRGKNFPIVFSPLLLGGYVSLKSNRAAKEWIKAARERASNSTASKKSRFLAAKSKMWKEAAKINARAPGIYFEEVAYWKRMIILSAGVAMNLFSAIVILIILYACAEDDAVTFMGQSFVLKSVTEWYLLPLVAAEDTVNLFLNIFKRLFVIAPAIGSGLYQAVITQSPRPHAGMIETVRVGAVAAYSGWASYLLLTHFFSVIMAAFNLLPLGILDGGQMAIITLERVFGKGKAVKAAQFLIILAGLLFLAALMLLMIGSDVIDTYNWLMR